GLWQLFHILSVLDVPGSPTPYEVMNGMHDFVLNFFGCAYCRDHFISMWDACENQRCIIKHDTTARKPLALWVWRNHNAVKYSQAIEEGVDSAEIHLRYWPSKERCPK
ncbi:unnamed protein product, partial [Chrysoparadoxa australica]